MVRARDPALNALLVRAAAVLGGLLFALPARAQTLPDETASYTLSVQLEGDHRTLRGEGTVRFTNRSRAATSTLEWHLYLNAFADARSLFARSGGAQGHRGHSPGEAGATTVNALALADGTDLLARSEVYGPDGDRTQMRTTLPEPLAPGATITLSMRWLARLPEAFARTGYAGDFTFAGQWFPKLAVLEPGGAWATFALHANSEFYADYGTYDVTLRVPAGERIGATGGRVASAIPGAERYVARGVHDFAFAAWAGFTLYEARAGAVALRVLAPPGGEGAARRAIETVQLAMPLFAERFGPYPYPNLTVVIPPWTAGGVEGMEYPTLITVPDDTLTPDAVHLGAYVTAHELAHQWFYGLFASNENRWPMLDEGLAEYATGLALRARYGELHAMGRLGAVPASFMAMQGAFSALASRGITGRAASDFSSFTDYANHVYRRTTTVLGTLESLDGPAVVRAGLSEYARRARFAHPTPDALLDAFAAVSPVASQRLESLLLHDASLELRVASLSATAALLERSGEAPLDAEVRVLDSRGNARTLVWPANEPSLRLTAPPGSALAEVRIDPRAQLPLDRDRTNNARAVSVSPTAALPLEARLAALLGRLLECVGP